MNKLLLTALCAGTAATVVLAVPRAATSSARQADGIQISVDGQQITVIGTESATLYSTDGKYLGTAAGDDRLTLTAPTAGVYLLRAGTNTRKVYVK